MLETCVCDTELSKEELEKKVKAMEINKSLGTDGITTNFYKYFRPLLGDELLRVFNHAFQADQLSITQHREVITLLFKKGNRTCFKNWQPITLLKPSPTDSKVYHSLPFIQTKLPQSKEEQ